MRERVLDYNPEFDFSAPDAPAKVAEMARMPAGGIDEMRKTLDLGKKLWGQVTVPAIIFQGKRDIAIYPQSGEIIYKQLASQDKTLKNYPKGGHELMRPADPNHREVWETIYQFIEGRRLRDVDK